MFQILTPERLREVLHYHAATGIFTWRVATSKRIRVGAIAGCKHKRDGRIYISVDRRLYKAHRLAWFYVEGVWPPHGIDHRDNVPDHNWFDNLRLATQAQNSQNQRRAHRDSKSGLLGVQFNHGKYFARLKRGGLMVIGKRFDSAVEAHASYLEIKALFHPFSTLTENQACLN